MRLLSRRSFGLVALVALFAAGCGNGESIDVPPVVPAALRYPVRTDLMAVGNLGAPPRWYAAGFPPLRSLRLAPHTPDPEFVERLRPILGKDILDPQTGLSDLQRDELGRLLDGAFGTPAGPTARIPTKDELAAMKADEMFDSERGKTAKVVMEETRAAAESAKAELGLDDESLARGSVVYRRWCVQCHGAAGGGDGANAIAAAAMPRDYRQGIFKFVTASPTSAVTKRGERGKPRKDDLKRTVRHGLDGSMMPPFPNIPDRDLDALIAYVTHLSVRGETEFEVMLRVMKPREDDPPSEGFTGKELEKLFASRLLTALAYWHKAAEAPVPVPPENCPTEADRVESAVRGHRAFLSAGCAGCHVNFGREPQLKYDMWGTVVQPRNLLLGVYRGGRRGEDLYARIYGGIYPSGMNEHKQLLAANPPAAGKPDFLWDVVHFVQALADPRLRHLVQLKDPAVKIEP
jgi:mono/diheme cytochrome c family protein